MGAGDIRNSETASQLRPAAPPPHNSTSIRKEAQWRACILRHEVAKQWGVCAYVAPLYSIVQFIARSSNFVLTKPHANAVVPCRVKLLAPARNTHSNALLCVGGPKAILVKHSMPTIS